ncbi:MAG: matrixin family metalloprotease [Microbacterium sp.]
MSQINLAVWAITDGLSTTCGNRSNGSFDTYRGTTTSYAGIAADGSCTGQSGKNEVSFGNITGTYLAWTCTYSALWSIGEADIKFDNSNRTWNTAATGCSGRYDLRGVATHEFGHFFGLKHSAQSAGQVMAPTTGTCNMANRQLGRGDQEGLRQIYGN